MASHPKVPRIHSDLCVKTLQTLVGPWRLSDNVVAALTQNIPHRPPPCDRIFCRRSPQHAPTPQQPSRIPNARALQGICRCMQPEGSGGGGGGSHRGLGWAKRHTFALIHHPRAQCRQLSVPHVLGCTLSTTRAASTCTLGAVCPPPPPYTCPRHRPWAPHPPPVAGLPRLVLPPLHQGLPVGHRLQPDVCNNYTTVGFHIRLNPSHSQ